MALGLAASAGLSLASGLLQGNDQSDQLAAASAAAQYNPTNISGSLGAVENVNGGIQANFTPEQQQMLQNIYGSTGQAANMWGFGGLLPELNSLMGAGSFTNAYQGLNQALGADPTAFYNQAGGTMQNLLGAQLGMGGAAMGGALGGLDPQLALGQGLGFLGQGQGFMNQAQNVQGLVSDRYNQLSELAAPGEERAYNSLQQRLFSQGRLGSTGGSRDISAFAEGLGRADLARQMEAQNLGLATQGQLFSQGAQAGQLGSSLLGQGYGAASQLGNLGLGMFSQGGSNIGNLLALQTGGQDAMISRAGQRISALTSLLGLGQGMGTQSLQDQLLGSQASGNISNILQNLINSSVSSGSQQAQAGANQAQYLSQQMGSQGIAGNLLGSFTNSFGFGGFSSPTTTSGNTGGLDPAVINQIVPGFF